MFSLLHTPYDFSYFCVNQSITCKALILTKSRCNLVRLYSNSFILFNISLYDVTLCAVTVAAINRFSHHPASIYNIKR